MRLGVVLALLLAPTLLAQVEPAVLWTDATQPRLRSDRWTDPSEPVLLGSLVKPFLALAYAETHEYAFPTVDCPGGERCWFPVGHGPLDIVQAITHSCNAYFDRLARDVDPARLRDVCERFRLAPPPSQAPRSAYWGLGYHWPLSPSALLHAYQELAARRNEPGISLIVDGLRAAAHHGTAAGLARALPAPSLAKTGTAPCSHSVDGVDGYAVALYPAENPRYTMLLQLHGRTGREAADALGAVLQSLISP